ncbi:hypothetical protein [Kutzneria albida]|uniref:Putative membrane protein n=1 Tax=Kutzneria albida DSM 43870 TaxID=1449976 RepID=W5W308_9PSEU|nr:hypothetical protein [Kutzneria albida]AHH95150.1 putative membrane protein [Kutzneria albida DSM 43870]
MALTTQPPGTALRSWLPPAVLLLVSNLVSLVGLVWDVQWHADVGPDTFFTLPHLFIYTAPAISGLTSLVVVLRRTAATRAGAQDTGQVGGRSVAVLRGTFAAPVGYLIAGCGSAAFLLYGLWDLWWHTVYGFDAVIDSPPHVGLILCDQISMMGTLVAFAAARSHLLGKIGITLTVGVGFAWSCLFAAVTPRSVGPVGGMALTIAGLGVFALLLGLRLLRWPVGGALAPAAVLVVIKLASDPFSVWAARWYAAEVGLPLRDHAGSQGRLAALMPLLLIGSAVLVEATLLLARRFGGSPRWAVPLAGALGGVLLAMTSPPGSGLTTGLAGAVVGAVAAWLGWMAATLIDQSSTEEITA